MSQDTIDLPDLPAIPKSVSEKEGMFKALGMLTQTHVAVTWFIADQDGRKLFETRRRNFIHRSDDGMAPITPPTGVKFMETTFHV